MEESFYSQIKRKLKRYFRSYSRIILMIKAWMFSLVALCLGFFFVYPQLAEQQKLFDVSISSDIFSDAQSLKLTNVRFYGVDENQTPYIVTADNAEEKKPGSKVIILDYPMADLVTSAGEAINITSKTGEINQKNEIVTLSENVEVFSSNGYEIKTSQLNFDMKSNVISSSSVVNAKGDFGSAVADGIQIEDKGEKILFKGKTVIKLFER